MIQYAEAIEIVRKEFSRLKPLYESVNILDSINRVLAEDIFADTSQPLFTNSAMDGYAIRFSKGMTNWKVIGEISAGKFKDYNISGRRAVMLMTGSRMPGSADTVIPIEQVDVKGKEIRLKNGSRIKKSQHVRVSGEDVKKGEKILSKGRVIHANHVQLAASSGREKVGVFRRLKAGILVTGNELIGIGRRPSADKVRASNLYSLLASASECGLQTFNLGISKDDKEILKQKIKDALENDINILISSGGVSEGKYDYLPEVYKELDVKILFHKVNIKPGKPMLFGVYKSDGKRILVFGLPGNPVSCFVDFNLFVRNIYYSNIVDHAPFRLRAVLANDIRKNDSKRHFIRGILKEKGGICNVSVSGSQSSANALGLSDANVLIEFRESRKFYKQGSAVECIRI